MGDAAAEATADIPANVGTYEEMRDRYETRFISPAASDAARAEFRTATQGAEETLIEWHSRLRSLFQRAFPGINLDIGAPGQIVRDQFTSGLAHHDVREYVWDHRPATYAAVLEAAQRKHATLKLQGTTAGKRKDSQHSHSHLGALAADANCPPASSANAPTADAGIMAINPETADCHFCGKRGHFLRTCPLLTKARGIILKDMNTTLPPFPAPTSSSPSSSSAGRTPNRNTKGRKGKSGGNPKKGRTPQKRISALEIDGDPEDRDDHDDDAQEN